MASDLAVARAGALELANRFKTEGNAHFIEKRMAMACASYNKAITELRKAPGIDDSDSTDVQLREHASVLYANRAAALLGIEHDRLAKLQILQQLNVQADFIADTVWEAEILRSLDHAERDAAVAVRFNPKNAKAHFRQGLAALELGTRDPDATNRLERLQLAVSALQASDALSSTARSKAKLKDAIKKLEEETAMANVEPIGSVVEPK
eukprot:m.46468 g.46468  ORF g.46468 m.46468 type:complete len:209 (+) comp15160_c0_seq1:181-807(+)